MTFRASSATLRDAMEAIQEGSVHAAFALTDTGVLLGMVTDGDLRRALLGGATLEDPVAPFVRENPVVAGEDESRASVLDLMQARDVPQVPIVNDSGQMVGIHLLSEMLGRSDRPNTALILAGGKGSRLLPITSEVPKPMIKVAGRPILERLVNHLVGYGIRRIVLSVGHLADTIENHFQNGSKFGCVISYVRDDPERPLGTAGPLAFLPPILRGSADPVLVANGDLITDIDIAALLDWHMGRNASMTVGALPFSFEVPFGVLNTDERGKITSIVEKPMRHYLVSAGIYVISPSLLDLVPVGTMYPMNDFIQDVIARGESVAAWNCSSDWIDVGRPADLARALGSV